VIDELKKIRSLLFSDYKNFPSILDNSPLMLWLGEKNKTVYVNKSLSDFLDTDTTKDRVLLRFKNIHKDDLVSYNKILKKSFKEKLYYEVEYRLKSHDNEYKWIKEEGVPVLFRGDDSYKGFIVGCTDNDLQKKTELKLKLSEERYRRLFETARDGILLLDYQTGEITDVNPFLIQLLGYSKEEFLGKKLWEVGAFKNMKASKDTFKILQDNGYVTYDNLPLETKGGHLIDAEFVSNAYVAGGGSVMQCNIRDISLRKKAEAADKAIEYLKQEKLKTKFMADATHELRTPLAIIKGNVELALKDRKDGRFPIETFEAINVEVNHLAELLSDLTILTTESQSFQKGGAPKRKIKLQEFIAYMVERSTIIANTKNIIIECGDAPNVFLVGDKIYLEKLFSNIINNAIYYGKEKGIIKITIKKDEKDVIISITDNGIGIEKEDLPHIFDRFYRADNARAVNGDGTGLGLAISKRIVEAHEGKIEVMSVYKKGTTFTITLPFRV
jgi:PAS domain S-box-containing protein